MSDKKKNIWTDVVLPIVKYGIALLIGYLTGDASVINSLI